MFNHIIKGLTPFIIEQRMETEEDDFGGEELDSGQQGQQGRQIS